MSQVVGNLKPTRVLGSLELRGGRRDAQQEQEPPQRRHRQGDRTTRLSEATGADPGRQQPAASRSASSGSLGVRAAVTRLKLNWKRFVRACQEAQPLMLSYSGVLLSPHRFSAQVVQ